MRNFKCPNTRASERMILRRGKLGLWIFGCLALCFLLGCGGRDVEQVRVTGKVTFDGGAMPGPGTIYFTPVQPAEGVPRRPGTAHFEADGSYTAGSYEQGDGLFPGSYSIAIHCWEVAPTMEDVEPVSFIPSKYTNAANSGFTVDIPAGSGSVTQDFALTSEPSP